MRNDLDEKLCTAFPELFTERSLDPAVSAMGRGFECGDGWFPLLMGLCRSVNLAVENAEMPEVRVLQVKEKLGCLKFRFSGGNSMTIGMVRMAEDISMTIDPETGEWLPKIGKKRVET